MFKKAGSGIRSRQLWLPNCGDFHALVFYKTQLFCSAVCDKRSLRHGQFQVKERKIPPTEFIFFEKFFSTENYNFSVINQNLYAFTYSDSAQNLSIFQLEKTLHLNILTDIN